MTGTLVNYYIHCKRQCWLNANKMNMEDNSELVKMGKVIHELSKEEEGGEVQVEGIKVDKIDGEFVTEMKKSKADEDATRGQLLFYLWTLKQKGIERKGKLVYVDEDREEYLEMTQENEEYIKGIEEKIEELIRGGIPEEYPKKSVCNRCAYRDYCFI